MKKVFLIIAALVFSVFGLGAWRFLTPGTSHQPDYYISRALGSSLPPALRHVKTLRLFEPSMGEGWCIAADSITPADFDRLLQARRWEDGTLTGRDGEMERYFRAAWPGAPDEWVGYHFDLKNGRFLEMAVSPDHTRVIFLLPI